MNRLFNRLKKRKGFTLIEVIIVIIILGILASVALPKITGNINMSKAAEATNIMGAVIRAIDSCMAGRVINAANMALCDTWGEIGLAVPPAARFTYPQPFTPTFVAGASTYLVRADYVGPNAAAGNGDNIQYTYTIDTGATVKVGAGIFLRMDFTQ